MSLNQLHPGQFVREQILMPKGISVSAAAKLIGISRPGVSNFLNGKVAATRDMATRIERAFGIPAQKLLDLQAAFDSAGAKSKGTAAATRVYVPPFLSIKANDIEAWVSHNIPARIRLSVFLRTLVHSTGVGLTKVDFPGNDDAERPGWDGYTEAAEGTPWIPVGATGWEFGVNEDVKKKADGDFTKSVKAVARNQRLAMTFVFVTPRRWAGKTDWVKAMKAKGQWNDVRAYDASDLEQWLEQSLAGQAWFSDETARPTSGVRSLDRCWSDWSNVANPPLSAALFNTALDVARGAVTSFLGREAGGDPLVIAADSVEEALAFLSQLFSEPDLVQYRDRILVFDRTAILPKLAQGSCEFVAVVHSRDVERELGPYANAVRSIIVYPRSATNSDPHVVLEPLGYEAFRVGMEAMGFERDETTRYANASGRSLTVLRRQFSRIEAVRTPVWASDLATASALVPFLMVGTWNAANEADQIALSLLAADAPYDELDRKLQEFIRLNDAPVWSVGGYRGLVSKIDVLFAIAGAVTSADLNLYFAVAKMVLGEDDPALDLPESERWAADLHGKKREFSSALRDGISETLVLLSVHGKQLFGSRLGFDGAAAAARLVRELLEPVTARRLEANDRDLPVYAEAAPEEFLAILERDLRKDQPEVFGLLRPVDTGLLGMPCPRTGLLWALEGLAWNPATLTRAVLILGRLAEVEINDNWANKPIASLESIFRAWMPQTAADHDGRMKAMTALMQRHPAVGWKICVEQFDRGPGVGDYSHKPKWRPDGYGFGEPFKTWGPINAFVREMAEMALTQPSYTTEMLCDLVGRLHGLAPRDQERVWEIIGSWRDTADDAEKAKVREKVRVTVLSRRGRQRAKDGDFAALTARAKAVYESLQPTDLISKHEWLFRDNWVDESADELDDEEPNFRKREERIERLRTQTLREVREQRGMAGIYELAERGKAQGQIGWLLVRHVLAEEEIAPFVLEVLKPGANETPIVGRNLIHGALRAMDDAGRTALFTAARASLSDADMLRLLLLAPFRSSTWAAVDQLPQPVQTTFWDEVVPDWIFEPEEENDEAIRRLLDAQRPRAAFAAVHFKLEVIKPSLLHEMLASIAKDGMDRSGEYQLQEYDIKTAFSLLDKNPDLSLTEKASLEFAYIEVLARSFGNGGQHIPNLERYVEEHPEMFVQAVVWAYKRANGGEDPPEFRVAEGKEHLAKRGYRLLEGIERIPGHDRNGELDKGLLHRWIVEVRTACAELDRVAIGDLCLGKLLSHAPVGADGVWPCEAVRDVMEEIQSEDISRGAHTGLYNARGAHWRGEGGGQERELAAKYRAWGEVLQFTHPFVSSSLLMSMVRTYEAEADREDNDAGIRRRLLH